MLKMFLLFLTLILASGRMDTTSPKPKSSPTMYFPSNNDTSWETVSMNSLGWNEGAVSPLKNFLIEKHTKAFMILVNGRIVMEEYFDGQTASSDWKWNSAGKTLVSATAGIAKQEGLLNLDDPASQYLGKGWTREPKNKEKLITIRNLLTMTSGIDDKKQLVRKFNLKYVADAGTRWAYSNVFQKLMDVISAASKQDFETYFNEKLKNKIGMDGYWKNGIIFRIYHSSARSMARFGLLALNNGKWKNDQILDEQYFKSSIEPSQQINPSYGYFWWLNGKKRYMLPGGQTVYNGSLVPSAPSDMYAAMGAADQRIYVIPSMNMIVVRMGEASNPQHSSFAVSGFDNALWKKIDDLILP